MAEALHSLGAGGELLLASGWAEEIRLERKPPKNLEHFLGINDIRVAVERSARARSLAIEFFFAYWELLQQGWVYRIIPDAACQFVCRGETRTGSLSMTAAKKRPSTSSAPNSSPTRRASTAFPFRA
jgi:hypothetical protein